MKRVLRYIFLLVFLFSLPTEKLFAQSDETMAQTVIHLLSYVSMDYSGAVEDGVIIDDDEYLEQQEFSAEAYRMTQESSFLTGEDKKEALLEIQNLIDLVNDLSSEDEISHTAGKIISSIIRITGVETSPKLWPDIANGKILYDKNCASCHGMGGKGDGPAGINLNPLPSDFFDSDLMDNFSPYQAYNSIRLGVPGTGMVAFELSEAELWDLAFYVKSFRFSDNNGDKEKLENAFKEIMPDIGLEHLATMTDSELLDTLKLIGKGNPDLNLKALRSIPIKEGGQNSLGIARENLELALESYQDGNKKMARTKALMAYLEGIEPVEARLRNIDQKFVFELEHQMLNVRQAIEKGLEVEALEAEINQALEMIDEADKKLNDSKMSFWLAFLLSGSILLREGLEAFLLIAVVLALIRSAGAKKALPWLHGGWITAVILGIIGWFLSDYVIQIGGQSREIMEGLVALFAVAVLLWAGFWLHDKSHAKQWTSFVKNKIGKYLERDKMFGLAAFSFMVVFREAFEVILFLKALSLESQSHNSSAIGLGALAAVIFIAIFAYVFLRYSKMIPVRKVFLYSSWLIVLLAVVLLGKGIHALQESGWISVSRISSSLRIDWLGIYPTIETLLSQIVLLIVIFVIHHFQHKKMNKNEVKT